MPETFIQTTFAWQAGSDHMKDVCFHKAEVRNFFFPMLK